MWAEALVGTARSRDRGCGCGFPQERSPTMVASCTNRSPVDFSVCRASQTTARSRTSCATWLGGSPHSRSKEQIHATHIQAPNGRTTLMAAPYDVPRVQACWRDRWETESVGRVGLATVDASNVFVNLVEFPYPSAEGVHVGHVVRYAGVDAYSRYRRMAGKHVFQPIGFDAFGIHTENCTLRVGEHSISLTSSTTARFRQQLSRAGMAHVRCSERSWSVSGQRGCRRPAG